MRELSYRAAIREALWQAMEHDESVFLLGEDLQYGGVYGITQGFMDHFGAERIVNTPIAEMAIIGAATGAALMGMRPIAEIQFADFIAPALDQLGNMTAKYHYRTCIPVPMVLRAPSGAILTAHGSTGPFHSQNPEAWFAQTPGLKVVIPATPYDAKGLLLGAIADPNPVIYLEQKGLYNNKGHVPEALYQVPLGMAHVRRAGTDAVVITYGAMVPPALRAAETYAAQGSEVMVLDLRTLVPLDKASILDAVHHTGKVVLVHEATRSTGFGAEIAALITEEAFEDLDAPIVRVTAPDTPVPAAKPMAEFFMPNQDKIVNGLARVLAY